MLTMSNSIQLSPQYPIWQRPLLMHWPYSEQFRQWHLAHKSMRFQNEAQFYFAEPVYIAVLYGVDVTICIRNVLPSMFVTIILPLCLGLRINKRFHQFLCFSIGLINIGIVFLFIGNSLWCLYNTQLILIGCSTFSQEYCKLIGYHALLLTNSVCCYKDYTYKVYTYKVYKV